MTVTSLLSERDRVDEPQAAQDYSNMLSQVVTEGKAVIVRRNGEDLAAVIPLEYLELLREVAVRGEVEKQAAQIDWSRVPKTLQPPQEWFDDTDNPFEKESDLGKAASAIPPPRADSSSPTSDGGSSTNPPAEPPP